MRPKQESRSRRHNRRWQGCAACGKFKAKGRNRETLRRSPSPCASPADWTDQSASDLDFDHHLVHRAAGRPAARGRRRERKSRTARGQRQPDARPVGKKGDVALGVVRLGHLAALGQRPPADPLVGRRARPECRDSGDGLPAARRPARGRCRGPPGQTPGCHRSRAVRRQTRPDRPWPESQSRRPARIAAPCSERPARSVSRIIGFLPTFSAPGEAASTNCRASRGAVPASAVRCPILRPGRAVSLPYRCSFTSETGRPPASRARRRSTNRPADWPSPPAAAARSSRAPGRRSPATAARTGWSRRRRT